ncbi:MAG TPA: efflux RND transporter periplasmic adaptor subunit [Planctomycetota bacterium]|jgi:RND family efflux transporter MFP subunit|nr:efflux RND transporter periplasmic adaptor subunit [Planctomycetota bacterium]
MSDEVRSASRDLSALRIQRDPDRPGSAIPWILLLAVVLIGAGGGAWFYRRSHSAAEVEIGLVRLVGSGDVGAFLSASGYILPDRKADVSSRVFGTLEWVGIEVGSKVHKGDVIGRIANADIAAQVEEAKAALVDADREYERWKKIVEKGIEPKERLDRADTQLQLAKARLKKSEADFEYSLIRAPFDGVVVRRSAQAGENVGPAGTVQSGGSLCTLIDRASLEMVADVNETNIAKVQVGQKTEVATEARPDRKYRGEVRQIVPTADRTKGIVQVKIRLLDPDEALLPEMASRAAFLRDKAVAGAPRKLIAPRGSIRDRGGRKVVFIVESGHARMQAVETGAEGEDGTEILQGLQGGEEVVTGGAMIDDGAEVRLKEKK